MGLDSVFRRAVIGALGNWRDTGVSADIRGILVPGQRYTAAAGKRLTLDETGREETEKIASEKCTETSHGKVSMAGLGEEQTKNTSSGGCAVVTVG